MKDKLGYKFLQFLEDKGKQRIPFHYKLQFAPSTITEKDLHIKGSLELVWEYFSVTLPDNLVVEDEAILYGRVIHNLPKNFKVGNNLDIHATEIKEIPSGLEVGKFLRVNKTPIKSFPKDFVFPRSVALAELPLTRLDGDWSKVEYLYIANIYLESFPESLKNLKELRIHHYRFKELPDNLNLEKLEITDTERNSTFPIPNSLNVYELVTKNCHWMEMYGGQSGIRAEIMKKGGRVGIIVNQDNY